MKNVTLFSVLVGFVFTACSQNSSQSKAKSIEIASPASAKAEKALKVSAELRADGTVKISYSTNTRNSSTCGLSVTELQMNSAKKAFLEGSADQPGSINFTAGIHANTMCKMGFGPNSGSLVLSKGYSLPAITEGKYTLTINGESYGILTINDSKVELSTDEK